MPAKLRTKCPNCGKGLQLEEQWLGRRVRCRECRHQFVPAEIVSSDGASVVPAAIPSTDGFRSAKSDNLHLKSTSSQSQSNSAARQNEQELSIGNLGRFELKSALGQGAFGRVYRAYDPMLERWVALKMPRFAADDAKKVRRFHTEARAAASLRHPNIVAVYESGEADGQLYIAAEYVEGRPLSAALAEARSDLRRVAGWVRDLALALNYAHEEGIVHRDIKPENIMLGTHERLQIMDFGMAKRVADDSAMTVDGSVMGTPAYMSPEQAKGEIDKVGPSSDQYSLGVVLYELLTGQRPFTGASHVVMAMVIDQDPPMVQSINPAVPADLAAICAKAMEKEPARRYATTAELAADLDRFLDGNETIARPIGTIERAKRWCRRNPIIAGLSAMAGVLAIVALSGWVQALLATNGARKAAEAAETSRNSAIESLAQSYFEKGLNQCELSDVARGMLWMARGLKTLPDGNRRAEHAIRTNLSAWENELWQLEHLLPGTAPMGAVATSLDGQTCATGCDDGNVQLWDMATGKPRGAPLAHPSKVWRIIFHPDKKRLFVAHQDRVNDKGTAKGVITVWDLETQRSIGEPMVHPRLVRSAMLSSDGKMIFAACNDARFHCWDADSLKQIFESPLDPAGKGDSWVMAAALSPDGNYSAWSTWSAQMWDVAQKKPVGPALAHGFRVCAMEFTPDSQMLFTISWDGTAKRWHVPDGEQIGPTIELKSGGSALSISPDGRQTALSCNAGSIEIIETATGKSLYGKIEQPHLVESMAWSSDGARLLAGDSSVSNWNGEWAAHVWAAPRKLTQPRPPRFIDPSSGITSVAVSPDGTQIATGAGNGEITIWSSESGKMLRKCVTNGGGVGPLHLAYHPDSRRLIACRKQMRAFSPPIQNNFLEIWDATTGKPYLQPVPQPAEVCCATMNQEGSLALTACDDGTLHFIDMNTGKPSGPEIAAGKGVWSALISPDGRTVAAGFLDGSVRFFDAQMRAPLARPPLQHGARIWSLAFSPDGKTLLTTGDDKSVRFWNAETDERDARPALMHSGPVIRAVYSTDGSLIATASTDHTACVWDAATGYLIGRSMRHDAQVFAVAFHPNSQVLYTGSEVPSDGVRRWPVASPMQGDVEQLVARIEAMTGLHMDANRSIKPIGRTEWENQKSKLASTGSNDSNSLSSSN